MKAGTVKESGRRYRWRVRQRRKQRESRGLTVCAYNPGCIKLQGVLLDFYVNNVHQHMAGKRVVDAAFFK